MGNEMLKKLDEEIEAEERLMYPELFKDETDKGEAELEKDKEVLDGDDDLIDVEDGTIPEDVELEDLSEVEVEDVEVLDEGSDDEPDEKEKKPKRKSWKAEHDKLEIRYNNLRSATDQDKHQSRTKIVSLLGQIESLEEVNTSLENQLAAVNANKDIYAEIYTQEDIDVLGPEAIELMKRSQAKSMEANMAPIRAQLEALKKQEVASRKTTADVVKGEAYNIFLTSLKRVVPEFDQINNEDGFKKYMSEVEPGSNKTRKEELNDAVKLGNSRWAATFFNTYRVTRDAPKSKLDEKLMPKASGASTVSTVDKSKKKTYPIAEYERFMDKLTKGEYDRSKQLRETGKRLEAIYDRAYAEGRIV